MRYPRPEIRACLVCALAVLVAAGCRGVKKDEWAPNQAVLPTARIKDNQVEIRNIRNTEYRTSDDYTVHYYNKTFDLEKLDSVDFIVVPFSEVPGGAHTFLSFGFEGQDYVAISAEVRRKKGQEFDPVEALLAKPEIMLVVGDERDLIQLRTIHWLSDVYVYRAQTPRAQMKALFTSMLEHANQISKKPEYYNLVTNNCTTTIMQHVNEIAPNRIPYTYQVLFPAYSDELAYRLKLIKVDGTFEHTKEQARINEAAYVYRDSPDFSVKIREGHPLLSQKSWESDSRTLR